MTDSEKPCLFCDIACGARPANIVYRDEEVTAFVDINPVAPVHVLLIPNRHISSLNEADGESREILGRLLLAAPRVAAIMNVEKTGYRVVINTGPNAGQTVYHLHVHLLGGRPLAFRTQ